ncbi:MAG: putative toxin-antitoxin system toxin component, PIN family [Gammaproteobacteria bacterium]|nr:putative toxin-antitoxin system toxin component, PIN family [Gammaproteobacteria bacterium]
MRIVIDTNVWISRLLLADSVAAQAVDKALEQSDVMVSEATLTELADVLARDKFDKYLSITDREQFLRHLTRITTIAPVLSEVTDCIDSKDNQFLALAFDSESDLILTGDSDLLTLSPWRGIEITSPRAFLTA